MNKNYIDLKQKLIRITKTQQNDLKLKLVKSESRKYKIKPNFKYFQDYNSISLILK